MDASAFVDKWGKSRRSERSASQEHFLDLCEVLKHPKPGAVDPKGVVVHDGAPGHEGGGDARDRNLDAISLPRTETGTWI